MDDGPGCEGESLCFSSISAALEEARDRDTIMLLPGTHPGAIVQQDGDIANLRITSRDGSGVTTVTQPCISVFGGAHEPGEIWVDNLSFADCGVPSNFEEDGSGVYVKARFDVEARVLDNLFASSLNNSAINLANVGLRFRVVVARNRVLNQRAEAPAIVVDYSNAGQEEDVCVRLENNLVAHNLNGVVSGSTEVVNNTVVFNDDIGLNAEGSVVANNVVFGNGSDIFEESERLGAPTFRNNLVGSGQHTGVRGNFSADPCFVDAEAGDFRLGYGSPAAGRGDAAAAPLVDLDGRTRGEKVDIGAFEREEAPDEHLAGLTCGDGVIQWGQTPTPSGTFVGFETCDDGNARAGDGCSEHCQSEAMGALGQISLQAEALCAIRADRSLSCWGWPDVHKPLGRFDQVALSEYHACALAEDGQAQCWTENLSEAFRAGGTFRQLVPDYRATCGLRTDGGITCWDAWGVTFERDGSFARVDVDQRVCGLSDEGLPTCWEPYPSFPEGPFVQMIPNRTVGCGLRRSGELVCVPEPPSGSFFDVIPLDAALVSLDQSRNEAAGLRPDGRVVEFRRADVRLPAQDRLFMEVASETGYGCGLTPDRRVYCWTDRGILPQE